MHANPHTGTCLFCRIAAGQVPSHPVHEGERIFAFLDINPIRPGHTQIIPRTHFRYFDELPADLALEIVELGQKLSAALKEIYGVKRVAFLFTGGDIPHAHAHVVPMMSPVDITSRQYIAERTLTFQSAPRIPDDELAATAAGLRARLAP